MGKRFWYVPTGRATNSCVEHRAERVWSRGKLRCPVVEAAWRARHNAKWNRDPRMVASKRRLQLRSRGRSDGDFLFSYLATGDAPHSCLKHQCSRVLWSGRWVCPVTQREKAARYRATPVGYLTLLQHDRRQRRKRKEALISQLTEQLAEMGVPA